ncbi:uncharacterized protein LOC117332955 [Pecten maximus]|uniref:uncharacterized protein LOC117332955 n=1 Tax=Pecten maximus TaxID=6579 RepID=UPI0014588176|nr:uncharacterized protein LOC117332955 [Pecten maximus]
MWTHRNPMKTILFACALVISSQIPGIVLNILQYTQRNQILRLEYLARSSSIDDIWNERIHLIRKGCSVSAGNYSIMHNQTKSYFILAAKHNLTICKVAKSGSTLWSILALVLENRQKVDGIFNKRRSSVHGKLHNILAIVKKAPAHFSTTNVVISRDPYTRIFSAYIDRCFLLRLPIDSPGFVESISKGEYMTEVGKCGFIVTFHDFVDKITRDGLNGKYIDPHWCPVYNLCRLCQMDYHVAMKQETLTRDTEHILQRLNISSDLRIKLVKEIRGSGTAKMVDGLIKELYFYNSLSKWMNTHCNDSIAFAVRLWEAFKIQGYMRSNISFPFMEFKEKDSFDVKTIVEAVLVAMNTNPLSNEEKVSQRRQALVKAYEGMPRRVIAKIQAMYQMDFVLFGYDINPPS